MTPFRKSYEVIGYTYDADVHCAACARRAFESFERDEGDPGPDAYFDNEGNHVNPIFLGDDGADEEYCGDCFERLS